MASYSLQDITTAMTEAITIEGDRLKKKLNAIIRFDIDGEIYDYDVRTTASTDPTTITNPKLNPDVTIQISVITLEELLRKKLSPQQAFMKGKFKVNGKMSLAMKLQLILDTTRKYLAPVVSRM